jgi:hypothetical protein
MATAFYIIQNYCTGAGCLTSLGEQRQYCLQLYNSITGARWPNIRPNNSKEAAKNCPWPEKIGGRKMAEFGKKWKKKGRKIFLQKFW